MKKDVLVSISGLHLGVIEGAYREENMLEVVTPANYFHKDNEHYIFYDELVEGMEGTIRNKIKIGRDGSLEIFKTGLSNAHMVFEKNQKNLTYYETPFGQMLVSVNTKNMDITFANERIDVLVDYELDVNHEPMADCQIRLNITSKDKGEELLLQ